MNRINYELKQFTGISGKVYKIEADTISTKRFREYEILSLMLAFGSDFKTFYDSLVEISKSMGELNLNKITFNDIEKLKIKTQNLIAGIGNYTQTSEPKIIRFCALFCNTEGEDISLFTDEMIKAKYDDWGNIPISDFFLLVSELIPEFRNVYSLIKKETEQQS